MHRFRLVALGLGLSLAIPILTAGCAGRKTRAAARESAPMGSWPEWRDLSPLLKVARAHVDGPTEEAFLAASKLLGEGKAVSADNRHTHT